jgi:hypothetical protein
MLAGEASLERDTWSFSSDKRMITIDMPFKAAGMTIALTGQ